MNVKAMIYVLGVILLTCVVWRERNEFSFRGHNESAESVNQGNYVELVKFLRK